MLPNSKEQQEINELARQFERVTGAQVVAAVVGKADDYPDIPWRAFALGAGLAALAVVGLWLLVVRRMRLLSAPVAELTATLVVAGTSSWLFLRPALFGFVLTAVAVALLEDWLLRGRRRSLWALCSPAVAVRPRCCTPTTEPRFQQCRIAPTRSRSRGSTRRWASPMASTGPSR